MGINAWLAKNLAAMWSVLTVSIFLTGLAGHFIFFRMPDQEKRQERLEVTLKDLQASVVTKLDQAADGQAKWIERSERWKSQMTNRMRTVHLIACQAARRRSSECALVLVNETIGVIAPETARRIAKVQLKLNAEETKPAITSQRMAAAVGLPNKADWYVEKSGASEPREVDKAMRVLLASGLQDFEVEDSRTLKGRFSNGWATVTLNNAGAEGALAMALHLNKAATLMRTYDSYEKQGASGNTNANAYRALQELSADMFSIDFVNGLPAGFEPLRMYRFDAASAPFSAASTPLR